VGRGHQGSDGEVSGQTRDGRQMTPDSRALKKLGLGPDYSNAINAKSANFTEPPPTSTIPPVVTAGFASAAGVNP